MDSNVFEDWVFNTIIPVLPPNTNIIMDNAPYHYRVADKAPTSNSNKATLISWLNNRGVCFPPDLRKPELNNVVKMYTPPHATCEIDSKAA